MSILKGKNLLYLKICSKKKLGYLAFEYSGHGKSSGNLQKEILPNGLMTPKKL